MTLQEQKNAQEKLLDKKHLEDDHSLLRKLAPRHRLARRKAAAHDAVLWAL